MYYAVSVLFLGYTRCQGITGFNSDTKEFLEITPATARKLIDDGLLKGLKWRNGEDGTEFICDNEGWNHTNIPVKTACGKFRPLLNDFVGVQMNSMYTVVRKILTDYRGTLYEVISNKCARVKITEENLRALSNITNIAGVFITDEEITLCDGVKIEDRRAGSMEETVDVTIDTAETIEEAVNDTAEQVVEEKEPESMEELFKGVEPEEKEEVLEKTEEKEEQNSGKKDNAGHKNHRPNKKSSKQASK